MPSQPWRICRFGAPRGNLSGAKWPKAAVGTAGRKRTDRASPAGFPLSCPPDPPNLAGVIGVVIRRTRSRVSSRAVARTRARLAAPGKMKHARTSSHDLRAGRRPSSRPPRATAQGHPALTVMVGSLHSPEPRKGASHARFRRPMTIAQPPFGGQAAQLQTQR